MPKETPAATVLQPLDLSAFENTDSPEVQELKRNVERVAMHYARRHNWCSEVQRALAEVGITGTQPLRVQATVLGTEATVEVPLNKVQGKTAEQQAAAVAEAIGTIYIGNTAVPFPASAVSSMTVLPPRTTITGIGAGDAWVRLTNGRVLHLGHGWNEDGRYVRTACGESIRRTNLVEASGVALNHRAKCTPCARRLGISTAPGEPVMLQSHMA